MLTPPCGKRGSTSVSCGFLLVVFEPEPEAFLSEVLVPLALASVVAAAVPDVRSEAGDAVLLALVAVVLGAAVSDVAAAESAYVLAGFLSRG